MASMGLRSLDAQHLACAESVGATLVTVDRRTFLNRVWRSTLAQTRVLDP
jgi:predicted nucleic acid-binding protein